MPALKRVCHHHESHRYDAKRGNRINQSIHPGSPSPWNSPCPARQSLSAAVARFDCYPPVEDRSSISTNYVTTSLFVSRFISPICTACRLSSVKSPKSYLSVSRSPRPPSLLACARIHWPHVGILLDRRLGPPPGPGQKDH